MDRQWRPSFSSNPPPPSSPPHLAIQPLEPLRDELSHLSLTGSGSVSQFPNLPNIPNTNTNTNTNTNNNFFHLDNLEDEFTTTIRRSRFPLTPPPQDIIPNTLSGPASYHPNPVINNSNSNSNIPSSWLSSGPAGSVLGLGSGYVTQPNHFPTLLPPHPPRIEALRPVLGNNHRNNNNNDDWYNNILTLVYAADFLKNNNFLNQYNNNRRHYNYNYYNNYYQSRRSTMRPTTTPTRRGGGANPVTLSWEEIKGKVVIYAKDEELSKMMIKKLVELGHMEGLRMVISEIKEGLISLLLNSNGVLFFKRLLRVIDHQDIVEILEALVANQHDFLRVCLDTVGTMGVQEFLSYLDPDSLDEKAMVMNAIRGGVVTLAKNMNGFHCIKALHKVFRNGTILNEVADHCAEIAMDKSGCCVLQNCIEVQVPERERVIREIVNHALELSENDYGNYVVQYVIGLKDFHTNQEILRELQGNLIRLTKNKFGSHVVERLLSDAHQEHVEFVVNEVFNEIDDASFLEILQHPTGNYVAQSAVKRTRNMYLKQGGGDWSLYQRLVRRIDDKYAFLHSHVHGQRVLSLVKSHKIR